jgi:hypothetical protein
MTDGKDKIFAAPIADYFTEYMKLAQGAWKIDIKDVNETTKAMIAQVDDSLKAKYPGNKKKASVQGLRYKQYEDKPTFYDHARNSDAVACDVGTDSYWKV